MKWDRNNTFIWRHMAYKNLVKKDENSMKGVFGSKAHTPNSDTISNMPHCSLHVSGNNYFLFESAL